MPSSQFRQQLVERYKNNQASDEELAVFFYLLEQGGLDEEITNQLDWPQPEVKKKSILKRLPAWIRISAAAILLLAIAGSYFLFFNKTKPVQDIANQSQEQRFKNDVQPGGNKATLTLADGTVILLESVKNGRLADQGAATVLKVADGQLAYDAIEKQNEKPVYNTITTPKGGQYTIVLPDGSKVLLNAASSIYFPTAFTGNERRVEITGEVWFEVAKDAEKPFRVLVNHAMEVEVLGTHFNVNAYTNEAAIKTTLVKGAVKLLQGSNTTTLAPGEQAVAASTGNISVLKEVDMEDVTAWKNGMFYFDNTPIESIMRQVERWYDVTISYEGKVTTGFNGRISRSVPVSRLLRILEMTGDVHFLVEGKNITVLP